eukprot:CAMPEP_0194204050 /NCGR_PEP_ID=MMETSP0156-20130528/3674_1 /TAXON_ID=33649 /ORGANISM="Thalassionema nitzschioides, Strain L26-B" /LENGTH=589 /DNA_ID=CAMNT_0038929955 /DNA_START=54 /DNA_END=1823 /DNA_ORIENTATION=-
MPAHKVSFILMRYLAALCLLILCQNVSAFQQKIPSQARLFRTTEILPVEKANKPFPLMNFSPLFSSSNDDDSSKRRRPFNRIRKTVLRITATISRGASRFSALSRRAKAIVCVQLLIVFAIFGGIARSAQPRNGISPIEVPYSQFMDIVDESSSSSTNGDKLHAIDVKIGSDRIGFQLARSTTAEQRKALQNFRQGKGMDPEIKIPLRAAYTRKVAASPELVKYLRQNKMPFRAATGVSNTSLLALSLRGLLMTFYLFYMWRVLKAMTGSSGSSPGKLADVSELPLASFSDIQGIDSAKFEVMELVDTLRNPGKYAILGARAPKGLLLEGPPGTGKTLLARATAATAGVPLLYCSGSDFVEMFVGRGAARVRKTFEKASKLAPCLIFIDELDALGKSRDTGMMANIRSNDESEQTLNQLLACMDGLDTTASKICVMAATNRREVLDAALLRPGRFDRIVRLELPDAKGREQILRVHAKKLPGFKECEGVDPNKSGSLGIDDAIDLSAVASATTGLSGAELEFIVNEAAIRAVRRVSAALRDDGVDPKAISASVCADDFVRSVRDFFVNRKRSVVNGGDVRDLISNVWKG